MITNKKQQSVSSVPVSWFSKAVPALFSRKISDHYERDEEGAYFVDNENIVLGYESGWPSSFKKPN